MWRFVVICLGVLAFAFYELSGGADYEPAPNSLQAQAKLPSSERLSNRSARAEPAPAPQPPAPELAAVEPAISAPEAPDPAPAPRQDRVSVSLDPSQTNAIGLLEELEQRPIFDALTTPGLTGEAEETPGQDTDLISPTPDAQPAEQAVIDAAVAAALGQLTFEDSQIRLVSEPIIDVRTGPGLSFDLVTRIRKGTEVAVLEDPGFGWLNVQVIDQFQSGWVAEWLLQRPE